MGHADTSLEEKIRLAIRAAKFDETPKAIWLKVLPTIAEGVSTTRANEMFCWARSMILDQERGNGLSEPEAHRNMVQRLLASDDGHGCSVTRIARDKSGASADRFTSAKAS